MSFLNMHKLQAALGICGVYGGLGKPITVDRLWRRLLKEQRSTGFQKLGRRRAQTKIRPRSSSRVLPLISQWEYVSCDEYVVKGKIEFWYLRLKRCSVSFPGDVIVCSNLIGND